MTFWKPVVLSTVVFAALSFRQACTFTGLCRREYRDCARLSIWIFRLRAV